MNIRASIVTRASVRSVLLALSLNIVLASAVPFTGPEEAHALTGESPGATGLNLLVTAGTDPGDADGTASFTVLVWNAGTSDAVDVVLHDDLPPGLAWDLEQPNADADDDCGMASSQLPGGESQMSIDCSFGTLAPSDMSGGKVIRAFADADAIACRSLENAAWADASNAERIDGEASIEVGCAALGIEKAHHADGPVLPGSEVGYTLALTVSDGPASTVVVVDDLPDGLAYVAETASHGGRPGNAPNTIEWNLGELADGEYTLTYQAVVSDAAKGGDQLVNVASATSPTSACPDLETLEAQCDDDSALVVRAPTVVIDEVVDDEAPDGGGRDNDPIARGGELGGNPASGPVLPDTAVGTAAGDRPITVSTRLLAALLVGSLGTLALASVRSRNHLR